MKPSKSLVILLLATPSVADADRRAFTRTYEYVTMPEGETELEVHSTQTRATWDDPSTKAFELQLEIEHGITERWDLSLLHVFDQVTGATPDDSEAFHFSELKLRTRYRFAERGDWPVDLVAYAEAAKQFGVGTYGGELRAVVARDLDRLTIAANPVGQVIAGSAVEDPILAAGYAAGVTYEVMPEWKVGAESWGTLWTNEDDSAVRAAAGPSISWAPASTFWATTTAGFGLTEDTEELSVRLLLGLAL